LDKEGYIYDVTERVSIDVKCNVTIMVRNIMFHDAIDRIRNDVKINFAGRV
jgi:hypothetical protein